jgi:hypothetical protein
MDSMGDRKQFEDSIKEMFEIIPSMTIELLYEMLDQNIEVKNAIDKSTAESIVSHEEFLAKDIEWQKTWRENYERGLRENQVRVDALKKQHLEYVEEKKHLVEMTEEARFRILAEIQRRKGAMQS